MAMVHIRPVALRDLNALAFIEAAGFPATEAAGKDNLRERLRVFPQCFLVAECGGIPVGYIGGCVCSTDTIEDAYYESTAYHDPQGPYQSVFSLVVLPEWQQKGIAARLMRAFIAQARQQGRRGVILTCKERLIPFYSHFGYRCLGVSRSVHGGARWYDMKLVF